MRTAALSTKGKLVVPHRFRQISHLRPGDKLVLQRDAPNAGRRFILHLPN